MRVRVHFSYYIDNTVVMKWCCITRACFIFLLSLISLGHSASERGAMIGSALRQEAEASQAPL